MRGPSEQERRRKTALDVFVSNQTETIFVEYILFFFQFDRLTNLWVSLNTQKEYIGIYKKAMEDIKRCSRDLLPWTAVV